MELRPAADSMSFDGHSDGVWLRGLSGEQLRQVTYLTVFPNVLLSLHPDYVMTHLIRPVGPDRTRIDCSWAFAPEAVARPGFDPAYGGDLCGLTPQYTALEALHERLSPRGFSVVGFPCNQFGGQEPGTSEEIAEFCSATYGVTFPLFEKIEVNGVGRHLIYDELTAVADAEGAAGDIQWNFEKFLIRPDGSVAARFRPRTVPDDPEVLAA